MNVASRNRGELNEIEMRGVEDLLNLKDFERRVPETCSEIDLLLPQVIKNLSNLCFFTFKAPEIPPCVDKQLNLAIKNLSRLNPPHGSKGHRCSWKTIAKKANDLLIPYHFGLAYPQKGPVPNRIKEIEDIVKHPCATSKLYLDLALLFAVGIGCVKNLKKVQEYLYRFVTSRSEHPTAYRNLRVIVKRIYFEVHMNKSEVSRNIRHLCLNWMGRGYDTRKFFIKMKRMDLGSNTNGCK